MKQSLWLVAALALLVSFGRAGDIKITIPRRAVTTPVQSLNRQGVDAVRKHQYDKAAALFYKAYLYDPNDAFTLNNLAYIAELQGQVERSLQLYELASRQMTDAVIDVSSSPALQGGSFRNEINNIHDPAMQVSRANVGAVHLLSQGRTSEAEVLLQRALLTDPHNAFTLNNLGVTAEAQGDLESALKYYSAAAAAHSSQPVVVTFDRGWRGKAVSAMADQNAKDLQSRLRSETSKQRAARLRLRGVGQVNRNNPADAEQSFREAYRLDPENAFSLNDAGFVAEMNGDLETAQFFYERARQAPGSTSRVGLATSRMAEGKKVFEVSDDNDQRADNKLAQDAAARRREPGPVQLKHRDNTPVIEPAPPEPQPTAPPTQSPKAPTP